MLRLPNTFKGDPMGFIVRFFLLMSLLFPAYAAATEMYIIIGSFISKERADKQLLVLQKTIEQHEDVVELKRSYGFDYAIRPSGEYHRIAIGPFSDVDVLQPVIDKTRESFADAFVSRYGPAKIASNVPVATNEKETLLPNPSVKIKEMAVVGDWSKSMEDEQRELETAAGPGSASTSTSGGTMISYLLAGIVLLLFIGWVFRKMKKKIIEPSPLDMYDFEP